jgi:FixJ family two-component response regulator
MMSERSSNEVTGVEHFPERSQTDTLTLLDRVADRDRAILAMLLEHVHPDDIAATLGVSAATLRRRRAHIIARLRSRSKRRAFAGPTGARGVPRLSYSSKGTDRRTVSVSLG